MADRTASVTRSGSLTDGAGTIESVGSGAGPLDVTWACALRSPAGARARRSCSRPLTLRASRWRCRTRSRSAGSPPERLETSATVTFVPGTGITKSALRVRGTVPGIEEAAFLEAAEGARVGCPVSKALAAVPEITLDAALVRAARPVARGADLVHPEA